MASPAKKKKHTRSFQDQWLADPAFKDWLIKDESDSSAVRMKCCICCETKQKNIFTTGCTDFQCPDWKMTDICLMVICGLPASGKSRFCHQLKQSSVTNGLPYNFLIIEYDKLLSAEEEKSLIEEEDEKSCEISAWKRYRLDILNCVDLLIGVIKSYRHRNSTSNVDNTKRDTETSRTMDEVHNDNVFNTDSQTLNSAVRTPSNNQQILNGYLYMDKSFNTTPPETEGSFFNTEMYSEVGKSCDVENKAIWTRFYDQFCYISQNLDSDMRPVCFVIDDNMYYRSMRYSYNQLAKKYSTGFCQVYIQTSVDKALGQNKQRNTNRVSETTIRQMAEKYEEPLPYKNTWEQNTLVLCNMPELDDCTNRCVIKMVDQALSHPVEDITINKLQIANKSREICSDSFLHQSDQILRKLVSFEMLRAKGEVTSKQELKSLAERLQLVRRQILDNLKSGEILVPENIVFIPTDSSKDESSDLFIFLKYFFEKKVKGN